MKLIVGLGNPDLKYDNTRHNVGFMLVDYIFDGDNFVVNKKMNAMEYITNINGEKIVVIKPTTYMNLSGDAVIKYMNFYKIDVSDIMVIQDDLDMPLGNIKLMCNRGDGGHNGIKDIINQIGTKEFLRLKIGISKNSDVDTRDFVLGKFNKKEEEIINNSFSKLKDLINDFCYLDNNGLMNKYNNK